jgi:hypothetical protein
VAGEFHVGCIRQWAQDSMYSFGTFLCGVCSFVCIASCIFTCTLTNWFGPVKETGGYLTMMLLKCYGVPPAVLEEKWLGETHSAPRRHELSCYGGSIPVTDPIAFHERLTLPLKAPDAKVYTIRDSPRVLLA